MAQDFNQESLIDSILGRATGPVRRLRNVLFVRREGGPQILEDVRDHTDIGPDGGIETTVGREAHFHGCMHFANNNLGGLCECGVTVCDRCLVLCSACGNATCPKHRAIDPDDARLIYCVSCAEEILRARRIRRAFGFVASFFVEREEK